MLQLIKANEMLRPAPPEVFSALEKYLIHLILYKLITYIMKYVTHSDFILYSIFVELWNLFRSVCVTDCECEPSSPNLVLIA